VSTALNLLRQGASKVQNGNLLTLPVGGGLLYVEPVYVQSTGSTSYPTLQRVLVAFGDKVGFAPTLDEALKSLFGGNAGASAGDAGNTGTQPSQPSQPTGSTAANDANAQLNQALQDARKALTDSQSALQAGNFSDYGAAQQRLSDAVQRALDAEAKLQAAEGTGSSTGSASPSPSAGATPSPTASR
jgi:uncharacterized membrane protein (UPF0182 family)